MSPFPAKIFSGWCEKVFYFSPILSWGDLGEYGINQTQVVIQFIMFFPLRITAIVFVSVDQILIN